MTKTQETRSARLSLQLGMIKDGKPSWAIRQALKEFDAREIEPKPAKERAK
jgi:hypothetical protein